MAQVQLNAGNGQAPSNGNNVEDNERKSADWQL